MFLDMLDVASAAASQSKIKMWRRWREKVSSADAVLISGPERIAIKYFVESSEKAVFFTVTVTVFLILETVLASDSDTLSI